MLLHDEASPEELEAFRYEHPKLCRDPREYVDRGQVFLTIEPDDPAPGYLPAAMRNYLARLGWSHGDDEFFTSAQAIEWFGLEQVGKSAARFDFAKLENLSGQHIRATPDGDLVAAIDEFFAAQHEAPLSAARKAMLTQAMPGLKERAKTLVELIDISQYILSDRPFDPDQKAAKHLAGDAPATLRRLTVRLQNARQWTAGSLEEIARAFAEEEQLKLGRIAQPLRVALTGRAVSPGVFDVMETLGAALVIPAGLPRSVRAP